MFVAAGETDKCDKPNRTAVFHDDLANVPRLSEQIVCVGRWLRQRTLFSARLRRGRYSARLRRGGGFPRAPAVFSSAMRETAPGWTVNTAFVQHLRFCESAFGVPNRQGVGNRDWE